MKTHLWMAKASAIGALALLAGCNSSSTGETTSKEGNVAVTIQGTNGDGVKALPLALGDVNVKVDGRSVATTAEPSAINLASGEERVAARFMVPSGAQKVLIEMKFDDYGGYETTNGKAGVLDARGTSVSIEMPAREVVQKGVAEIKLDLARSLAEETGRQARAFTPHLTIDY